MSEKVEFPKRGIKARWNPKMGLRFEIDPSERQVIDNRGGAKLKAKTKPAKLPEQTSWLK